MIIIDVSVIIITVMNEYNIFYQSIRTHTLLVQIILYSSYYDLLSLWRSILLSLLTKLSRVYIYSQNKILQHLELQ